MFLKGRLSAHGIWIRHSLKANGSFCNMHWNVVVKFLLPKSIWSEDWTLILLRFMQNCLINLWNVETSVWRGRIIPFTDFLMIYLFSGLECFQDLTRILNNDIPCARQKQLRKFVSLWLLIANWLFEYSPMKYTFPRRKTGRLVERNKMWGCRSDLENRDVHIKKHSEKSPLRLFKNLFRRAQKCPTTSGNFFEIQ